MRVRVVVDYNKLPAIARQLPEAADVIINGQRGPEMVTIAQRLSRVDQGDMQRGWRWDETGQGTGELVNDVEHTVFNEYGTRNMSAQPMARPALAEVGPKILDDFRNLERMLA